MKRRLLVMTVSVILLAGAVWILVVPRSTNCGGNSAALSNCYLFAMWLQVEYVDRPGRAVSLSHVSPEFRKALPSLSRQSWLGEARFLVLDKPFSQGTQSDRRVVYACDKPFRNVPERLFYPPPPSHAVVFSDGAVGLISTAEYAALDFSQYRDLNELYSSDETP